MILFKKLPLWTSDKASALRELLENSVLQDALLHAYAMRPNLVNQGSISARLTNAGMVAGYEQFVENLVALTVEESAAPDSAVAYPALEDDSKWPKAPPVPDLPQSPEQAEQQLADITVSKPEHPTT